MVSRTLLACALLACCLAAARATKECHCWDDDTSCVCGGDGGERRRLLAGQKWRKGVVRLERVVGCIDEDEGTPCLSVDEVQDAVHNKVINVTVLAIESEKPDPRLEAWEGQTLSFFFNDGNTSVSDGTVSPADVHAAVSHLDYCPVGNGNVLNITARLDAETTFEGAPVRGDLLPGTVVEVLVGQHDVMEQRGHEWHLIAHLGDSAAAAPDATCSA